MRTALTLDQAKAQVQLLLEAQPGNEGWECRIHLWWEGRFNEAPPCVGVRIAEISFVKDNAGASWMAVQPEVLGILAAAERCIIERMVCTCDEEVWDDEIAEADWRLRECLKEPR